MSEKTASDTKSQSSAQETRKRKIHDIPHELSELDNSSWLQYESPDSTDASDSQQATKKVKLSETDPSEATHQFHPESPYFGEPGALENQEPSTAESLEEDMSEIPTPSQDDPIQDSVLKDEAYINNMKLPANSNEPSVRSHSINIFQPKILSNESSHGSAYQVIKIESLKGIDQLENLKFRLMKSEQRIIIGYQTAETNGNQRNQFSSFRGIRAQSTAKQTQSTTAAAIAAAMGPVALTETLQWVTIRIDNSTDIFLMEMSVQPTTSASFFNIKAASSKSNGPIADRYELVWNMIKRKIIPEHVQLLAFNAQRLLRILQLPSSPIHKIPLQSNTPSKRGSQYDQQVQNTFWSFEEPILDPTVAAWVTDPEMATADSEKEMAPANLKVFEFQPLIDKFARRSMELLPAHKDPSHLLVDDTWHSDVLVDAIWKELHEHELIDIFVFEMRQASILARMESRGMAVDLSAMDLPKKNINTKLAELTAAASKLVGKTINLTSPSQVSEALYDDQLDSILPPSKPNFGRKRQNQPGSGSKTSSGKHYSTRHSALMDLKKKLEAAGQTQSMHYKLLTIVMEHRPAQKLLSFITSVEQHCHSSNGIRVAHARWLQMNTASGRITSAAPNMQQLPTEDEIKNIANDDPDDHQRMDVDQGSEDDQDSQPNLFSRSKSATSVLGAHANSSTSSSILRFDYKVNVRAAYVSRAGYKLVGADYSQIEMRVLAQVANDTQLIRYFKSGQDIHRQVAATVFGVSKDKVTSEQREWCKRIVYGIVYGMGIQALSASINVTTAKGKEFYDSFMGSFPKVSQWLANAKDHVRQFKEVRTLLNRRRTCTPTIEDSGKFIRQGVNTTIQGSAADIVKLAMYRIDLTCYNQNIEAYLVLQIHDELIYEVKEEHIEEFKIIMKRCMEEEAVPHFQVPLVVNLEVGTAWGLMK